MPEPVQVYEARVRGLLRPRHEILRDGARKGVLTFHRRAYGGIDRCEFLPEKGSALVLRREPGLLRGQFTLWATETHEWLGSTVRFSFLRREIEVSTGGRPYRLLPLPGLRKGWSLQTAKTGEIARIHAPLLGRDARIEVYRRLDFMMLLLAYAVGAQIYPESILPGPVDRSAPQAPAGRTAGDPAKARS